jgi:hypothetical protein
MGKCDTQVHYFSLIRVLAVYSEHDFVLILAVDLHGDDRSPRPFGTQHSQILGPEHWNGYEMEGNIYDIVKCTS